jgi:hypothetical protein
LFSRPRTFRTGRRLQPPRAPGRVAAGRHRREKSLPQRSAVRATATLALLASVLTQPFAVGTAHAAGGCEAPTPSIALACAGRMLTDVVDSIASVQQLAGASVTPVPITIIVDTSLLDSVNQAADQVTQAAEDCLTNPDSVCAVTVRSSELDFVSQTVAQAEQEATNCVTQSDPTCASVVAAINQEAQAVQLLLTSCLGGTNDECNQLVALVGNEVGAFEVLAEQCASGQDATCNTITSALSQVLNAAVTCIIGPINPAAHTADGIDVGAACDEVKSLASSVVDELVACANGTSATCADVIATAEAQVQSALATVTALAGSFDPGEIGIPASPLVMMPTPDVGAALQVPPSQSSSEDGALQASATQPNMTPHGGSIVQAPRYVVTYWGWGTNTTSETAFKTRLQNFLGAVGGSAWQNVQTQYYDTFRGAIRNAAGEYGGAWADDDASHAPSSTPTLTAVANEAARAVTKHYGNQLDTVDIIVTPPGHDAAGSASYDPTGKNTYCGYHESIDSGDAKTQNAKFIYLPYDSIRGVCNGGLSDSLAALTIVTGHELTEADTDPTGSGWYDSRGPNLGEDGDKCEWGTGPSGNGVPAPKAVPFGSTSYWVQPIWSNQGAYCSFSDTTVYYPTTPASVSRQGSGQGPLSVHYASASCTFSPTSAGSGKISGRLTMNTSDGPISESIRCDMTGGGSAGTFVGTSTAAPDAVTSGTNPDGAIQTNQLCVSGVAKTADQTIITVPKVCVTF